MIMSIELSKQVKEKLSEAVKLWADEHLIGKPEILLTAVYFSLEEKLIAKTKEINEVFS